MTMLIEHVRTKPGACGASVFLILIALTGCTRSNQGITASRAIPAMLERQAAAWNTGDIDAFMEPYWRSPQLTFSSAGRCTRGWSETRARYHQRYPTAAAMGRLTFDDLEITELGSSSALVLGAWHLDREDPVGGLFTLVLRKDAGRWTIIHDHTSRLEE